MFEGMIGANIIKIVRRKSRLTECPRKDIQSICFSTQLGCLTADFYAMSLPATFAHATQDPPSAASQVQHFPRCREPRIQSTNAAKQDSLDDVLPATVLEIILIGIVILRIEG